jgi:trimeric autotransporter adhesin
LFNNSTTVNAKINPAKTTAEMIVSPVTLRFMDNITLTATVTPLSGYGISGTVQFKVNGANFGPATPVTSIPGDAQQRVQGTLAKQFDIQPGTYSVTAEFTSTTDNYNCSSSGSISVQVNTRDATPYTSKGFYTGDIFTWTTSTNSSKGTLTLAATIKDVDSPNGDVRGAKVTFYTNNNNVLTPILGAKDLPVGLINIDDHTIGAASAIVQFDIGAQNAGYYNIAVAVTGAYKNNPAAACSQKQITIAKPLPGGYIMGAGEVTNETSSGYIRGAADQFTDFECDITYTKSGSNPKGKNSIWVRSYYKSDGVLDTKMHTYWIQSTAISMLSVSTSTTGAVIGDFSSKANLYEQISDVGLVLVEGGAALQMQAYRRTADQQIAITLYRKAGGIWFSSNWVRLKTQLRSINTGGEVFVSLGSSAGTAATNTDKGDETAGVTGALNGEQLIPLSASLYPNPTKSQFNIKLQSSNTVDAIAIVVYSVQARIIEQKQNLHASQTIEVGAQYRPGVYILEIIQGNQHKQIKLVKIPD